MGISNEQAHALQAALLELDPVILGGEPLITLADALQAVSDQAEFSALADGRSSK